MINTSLPFAMEQLCFNGGGIIVSMFIVKLGTESVAANAVSNSTLMVFYSMGLAVSNLSVTIIGQCIGAKDKKMARYYGKKMVWLGEVSILVSLAALLPFLRIILKLYQAPENTLGQIIYCSQLRLYRWHCSGQRRMYCRMYFGLQEM